jgi:iron complex outermembrane receptor protein
MRRGCMVWKGIFSLKNQSVRLRLVASTILVGVGLAMAGEAAAQDNQVSEVVITGSRIPLNNVDSASPVSTVGAADIAKTNAFSVGDVLTRLAGPDYSGGISGASNNGGVGLSEIGLRNLQPQRTLILIDGQRLVPVFTATATVPDLNSVPISMIDRVEVLRDGASSIYGADAIGGVINIITKTNFSGFQVDASGGVDQHGGGGGNYSLSATAGMNSDKGNLTFSIVHEERDPVLASARDWAVATKNGTPFAGGSVYRSQLNILQDEGTSTVWNNGVETNYNNPALASIPCLAYIGTAPTGRVKLNANCGAIASPATLTSGLSRTQLSFSSHYNLTDHLRFVSSGFFTDRHSEQRLRPEPLLGDSIASTYPATGVPVFGGFQIPALPSFFFSDPNGTVTDKVPCFGNAAVQCMNAFLTPNQFDSRNYQQTAETYRIRTGFEGDFLGFNW